MKRRLLLAAALLGILPVAARAQSTCTTGGTCTPIAKMACGAAGAAFPQCGADSLGNESYLDVTWTRSWQAAVGPFGEGGYRITHIPNADETLEYYTMGLHWNVPSVGQNQCRVFRELIIINPTIAWSADDGGRTGMKHFVWGQDGTNASSRGIFNLRSNLVAPGLPDGNHDPTHGMFRTQLNVGGEKIDNYGLVASTPYYVQTEMCTSSTSVATDGSIKVWVNNNTYASPSSQSTSGFAWPALDLNLVRLGFFGQSLGLGQSMSYDILKFEYDDQFSTNWNGANETGGTPAPTVTNASPSTGSTAGGTSLTITGTGFTATPTVSVGGVTCTSPHFTSATQIECTTGARSAGTVDVVVTNPDAQTGTLTNGFSYTSAPVSVGLPFRTR